VVDAANDNVVVMAERRISRRNRPVAAKPCSGRWLGSPRLMGVGSRTSPEQASRQIAPVEDRGLCRRCGEVSTRRCGLDTAPCPKDVHVACGQAVGLENVFFVVLSCDDNQLTT